MQASNGPGFLPTSLTNSNLRTDLRVELGEGTAVQYADGTTNRNIAVTRIWQLPKATPDASSPATPLGFPILLQVTPFDATFTAGAKLIIPVYSGVSVSEQAKVYRYDLTPGSTTFGQYVEVQGVTINQTTLIPALEVPIKETGYYLVGFAPPSIPTTIFHSPTTPARLGVVAEGKTPITNAQVYEAGILGQGQSTDEAGNYILRNSPFFDVIVQYLRPDGKVIRRDEEPVSNDTLLSMPTRMKVTARPTSHLKSGIVLLPDIIQMNINEQRYENFLLLQEKEIQQVSVTGASFASILRSGEGLYTLILKPNTKDFGYHRLSVRATDSQGQSFFRYVDLRVTAPNRPPLIAVPKDEYRVKVGETLSFTVIATDSDEGQKVSLYEGQPLDKRIAEPGNPASATYTFTPTPQQVGANTIKFSAQDDGFGALQVEKTVVVRVEAMPKPNEWTLISQGGLLGLLTDSALYGVPVSYDAHNASLNLIGKRVYRSTFGAGCVLLERLWHYMEISCWAKRHNE